LYWRGHNLHMTRRSAHGTRPDDESRLALAEEILQHRFADRELLRRALTHPSAFEHQDPDSGYERLEFLGDSVVNFLVAEEMYARFPHLDEGRMTRLKIALVAGSTLSQVASELGLADALILGESERGTGGRGMTSALENVYEALSAALYLDAGMGATRAWVERTLGPLVVEDATLLADHPKSALQELVQSRGEAPVYEILAEEGPPHDRVFTAQVSVGGRVLGTGVGRSKKEAEMAAAAEALTGATEDADSRP